MIPKKIPRIIQGPKQDPKEKEELRDAKQRLEALIRELRLIEARRNTWKPKSS